VLAQCFTIASWIVSVMAASSCFYMYVRPIPLENEEEKPREGFGYYAKQAEVLESPTYQQCVGWDSEEADEYFDSMWNAGKAMGTIAVIVGFVVMCIVICTCCVAYQLPTFDGLFWTCMVCFVAQCLTFLSWGSEMCDDYECTWAPGSGTNISAAMLWLWAANLIKSFPEALPPRGRGRRAMYEEDDEYYDDSPYLNPNGGFDDEYYGEEDEYWDPNAEQTYDDDDDYYDDGVTYDDREYPEEEYPEDDNEQLESEPSAAEPGFDEPYDLDAIDDDDEYLQDQYDNDQYSADNNDQYTADYYTENEALENNTTERQALDDYTEDSAFQDSWTGNDTTSFDDADLSASQAELSREELEYLGDQSVANKSIEDLD